MRFYRPYYMFFEEEQFRPLPLLIEAIISRVLLGTVEMRFTATDNAEGRVTASGNVEARVTASDNVEVL